MCVVILDIGKIQFIWAKSIHSKNISVEWKLDCVDEGVVKAYQIKYCRIVSRDKEKCLDEWQTIEVNATDSMEILLENLQSYQCYKIKIAMLSRTRQGPDSDILYVETLESGEKNIV